MFTHSFWDWPKQSNHGMLGRTDSPCTDPGCQRARYMLEGQAAEDFLAQLLRRIAAREVEALAEFYDQTAGALFSLAVRMLGDVSEAEEVTQDVFVQIWEKAVSFDAALGAPMHWALSITRHRAIDRLRARQRRARLLDEVQTATPDNADAQEAATELTHDELSAVRAALSSLPGEQRQAIELAFFKGMTHPEIAEALEEPLGTVKARIRRGMLKLRDTLQEYA
jgi:RNA polymerase sigma-70 factor (ECF subfamily)